MAKWFNIAHISDLLLLYLQIFFCNWEIEYKISYTYLNQKKQTLGWESICLQLYMPIIDIDYIYVDWEWSAVV